MQKTIHPSEIEKKWYAHWQSKQYFHSTPDEREPYSIVIPPPNVTGVLHMGHMLNNTIQDILIRRARLLGKNACWVPGTDHASIATEAKVVARLKEKGIRKWDISREEFLQHAWDWTDEYGGIILEQLKALGASCDWDRTRFTLEDDLTEAVQDTFIQLYEKGLVYRGLRMVNWDPAAKTALSNEEVIYKEVQSKLYYVQYPIVGTENEFITIATTRPETILGDTAVCVNPKDERYQHLVGKSALVPLCNREVPIIADDYVEIEFGTGCLKITPAHDENDFAIGKRHNLETIDTINEDGTMAEAAGYFIGEDRFKARKLMAEKLEELGQLVKVEEIQNKVGRSERTNEIIEPRLSQQWFLKMEALAKPALDAVEDGTIQFYPAKFKNVYRHWLENIQDWCISRQLFWGQRIPAWYDAEGNITVAKTEEEAKAKHKANYPTADLSTLKQDDDVVDTWFSSWLWPISVFDGFKEDKSDFDYYFPTSVLVTGWDIIFFWVARMIMAGYEFKGKFPFKHVYFTGMVRDKQGRKMSKQLGNSPDALKLLEQYGADGVRTGMLFSAPAGNDLLFDEKLCEQGRNFSNKLWNAARLIDTWENPSEGEAIHTQAHAWLEAKKQALLENLESAFNQYSLSEALKSLYNFAWDDFCSWYLEMVKPEQGSAIRKADKEAVIQHFEDICRMLHPYMPFITEEIWHSLRNRAEGDDVCANSWPNLETPNSELLSAGAVFQELVTKVREIRNQKQVKPKETVDIVIPEKLGSIVSPFMASIQRLTNSEQIKSGSNSEAGIPILVNDIKAFVEVQVEINVEEEKDRLEKDIAYQKGFIISVEKKLSNEKFVSGAPEVVVNKEKQKLEDGKIRLQQLMEALEKL